MAVTVVGSVWSWTMRLGPSLDGHATHLCTNVQFHITTSRQIKFSLAQSAQERNKETRPKGLGESMQK